MIKSAPVIVTSLSVNILFGARVASTQKSPNTKILCRQRKIIYVSNLFFVINGNVYVDIPRLNVLYGSVDE